MSVIEPEEFCERAFLNALNAIKSAYIFASAVIILKKKMFLSLFVILYFLVTILMVKKLRLYECGENHKDLNKGNWDKISVLI